MSLDGADEGAGDSDDCVSCCEWNGQGADIFCASFGELTSTLASEQAMDSVKTGARIQLVSGHFMVLMIAQIHLRATGLPKAQSASAG